MKPRKAVNSDVGRKGSANRHTQENDGGGMSGDFNYLAELAEDFFGSGESPDP